MSNENINALLCLYKYNVQCYNLNENSTITVVIMSRIIIHVLLLSKMSDAFRHKLAAFM